MEKLKKVTYRVRGVYTDEDMKRLSIYGLTHADVDGKSTRTKVQCTCPYCGNTNWTPELRHLLEDKVCGCPECSDRRSGVSRHKTFTEEEYAYLARYKITREMLKGKALYDHTEATCPFCGNVWNPTIFDLLHSPNAGCSGCKFERMWNTRHENMKKSSNKEEKQVKE